MAYIIPDSRFEMPELFEPGRKPVGNVQIDWGNPITRSLELFVLCDRVHNPYQNLVDGSIFESTFNFEQSNYSVGVSHKGPCMNASRATANQTIKLQLDQKIQSNHDYTFLGGVIHTDATVDHTLFQSGGTIADNNTMLIWADTLSSQLRPAIHCGSAVVGASGSIPINQFVVWGASITTAATNNCKLWVNGKQSGSAGDAGNPDISATNNGYWFDQDPSGTRGMKGKIFFVAKWGRHLSSTEHLSFALDPYQFLIPA